MTGSARARLPQLVDATDLPLYPISAKDRLDSHFFIQWNLKRWRHSEFRQLADPEVGWAGFQLICEAHDGTPIGTLPTDERLLARAAGVAIDKWHQLCERAISPLHNWHKVMCDNGEIRWAHHVVQQVAQEALEGRIRHQQSNEEKAVYARLKRIREALADANCDKAVIADTVLVKRIDDWLTTHCTGNRRKADYERALMHAAREKWFVADVSHHRS